MNEFAKIQARPKLNSPNMLATWPGVSNVALIVASYLQKKLGFKKLGEIEASCFFDPVGVMAQDNVIEAPSFPRNEFYYWKNTPGRSDLILFVGEAQPAAKGYELAGSVLDVGKKFQVKRVYTCAAALTRIHHSEPPSVWGVATTRQLAEELGQYDLVQRGSLQIAGLNGLLLGVAKERRMEGICLLGEVPMYATKIQNPMAALAILRVLGVMLGIEVDLDELTQVAEEARESMKQMASRAMGEYIDFFTEPLWERGDESSYEEDEDDDDDEDEYGDEQED